MTKHPHADLIKQMVDDDTLRATCTRWPSMTYGAGLVACNPDCDWRLVQPKPKTITIVCNGKTCELPEPMRVAPEVGTEYFYSAQTSVSQLEWLGDAQDRRHLGAGCCHATHEAAQAWVTAMAEIRGAK